MHLSPWSRPLILFLAYPGPEACPLLPWSQALVRLGPHTPQPTQLSQACSCSSIRLDSFSPLLGHHPQWLLDAPKHPYSGPGHGEVPYRFSQAHQEGVRNSTPGALVFTAGSKEQVQLHRKAPSLMTPTPGLLQISNHPFSTITSLWKRFQMETASFISKLLHSPKWSAESVSNSSLSSVWPFVTPWTVAHQAALPMGFSRQEYWSGLPFPFPGYFPDPRIEEPRSPTLQADSLP